MPAQTAATTIPAASPPAFHIPTEHTNHFIASGKAVVEWEASLGGTQYLLHPDPRNRHITFEACVEKNDTQCLSFFRLRVPAMHMHLHAIVLYIHIPPHHISSFEWTVGCDAANPAVQSKLGGDLTRLQFHLKEPVQVIVPGQVPLKPKKPATATVIKALESLTTALCITVYLEHTTLSKARLGSIAQVIQSGLSRPVPRYGDLHRLYKGMGGSILPAVTDPYRPEPEVPALAQADSPPSYDEIGPGPPMPPGGCSTSSTQSDDNVLVATHTPVPLLGSHGKAVLPLGGLAGGEALPPWAQSLFAELVELKGVIATQERVIQDLQHKLVKLEGQAKTQDNESAVLQRRMDETDVAIVDLDATATQQGESLCELEDSLASLQEDWDSLAGRRAPELEQVKEELRVEVMNRLRSALDSP
ncbi:hypothetical protein PG985_015312 [Apiospora marii]|uniref:uncharacterized protein n=1 Tax=Apiospora marii TaxID=335849 RepID=UPI00312EB8F4